MTEQEQLQAELEKQNENATFYQNKIVELTNQKDITHSQINDYIGCVKITQSQIKQLEDKLKALPMERWKPKDGETFYYGDRAAKMFGYETYWHDESKICERLYKLGVIRRTEAEAAEDGKREHFRTLYESLSDVTDEMWEDSHIEKHSAFWNYHQSYIAFNCSCNCRFAEAYFTSDAKCSSAISAIGESNFIMYVLNVRR